MGYDKVAIFAFGNRVAEMGAKDHAAMTGRFIPMIIVTVNEESAAPERIMSNRRQMHHARPKMRMLERGTDVPMSGRDWSDTAIMFFCRVVQPAAMS